MSGRHRLGGLGLLAFLASAAAGFTIFQKQQVLVDVTYADPNPSETPYLVTTFVGPDKMHRHFDHHDYFRFFPQKPYQLLMTYQWHHGKRHWDGPIVAAGLGDRVTVEITPTGDVRFVHHHWSLFGVK